MISQWFPPHERALAGGIFNAGTVIGAAAPLLIVPVGMVRLALGVRHSEHSGTAVAGSVADDIPRPGPKEA
ncbi:MAG: hypothetical protein R2724_20285 [Bryobacterales bacterium]